MAWSSGEVRSLGGISRTGRSQPGYEYDCSNTHNEKNHATPVDEAPTLLDCSTTDRARARSVMRRVGKLAKLDVKTTKVHDDALGRNFAPVAVHVVPYVFGTLWHELANVVEDMRAIEALSPKFALVEDWRSDVVVDTVASLEDLLEGSQVRHEIVDIVLGSTTPVG